ncbi:hypothetical protein [Pectobacterium brasiliense]|uniref:hypothetical protein n=1 Tax=Pectobacterium brasiliense TaxID=180957 RepID=UPI001EF0BA8D|nr:hypothetical protein [Pectobacterium brasiliense]
MSANQLSAIYATKSKVAAAIHIVESHKASSKPTHYHGVGRALLPHPQWGKKPAPTMPAYIKALYQHPSALHLKDILKQVRAELAASKK